MIYIGSFKTRLYVIDKISVYTNEKTLQNSQRFTRPSTTGHRRVFNNKQNHTLIYIEVPCIPNCETFKRENKKPSKTFCFEQRHVKWG